MGGGYSLGSGSFPVRLRGGRVGDDDTANLDDSRAPVRREGVATGNEGKENEGNIWAKEDTWRPTPGLATGGQG